MSPELRSYGVSAARTTPPEFWDTLEEVRLRGFSALPSLIPLEEVRRLNEGLDRIYEIQCDEIGGDQILQGMNDGDIVRCPLAYDPVFMSLATHPTILGLARAMLGENIVLLMQNGIINRPERGQFQSAWHRDLNYQDWVSSRPLAVSALVALEDFNLQTGGTAFLAGSHRVEEMPSADYISHHEETPSLPAGTVIFFDSMVFHRSGYNSSKVVRRAVNHVIGVPILAQQIDIPAALGSPPPPDAKLSGYLGYRWRPAQNVADWRRRKLG